MTEWFTADLHFGHRRIIELCDRPFRDAQQMDETLIANWNERVHPSDVVHVLGDYALGHLDTTLAYTRRLNGQKRLVLGNHDRAFPGFERPGGGRTHEEWANRYLDEGFLLVSTEHWLGLPDLELHLSHFPYVGDSHEGDRFVQYRPRHDGEDVLVHGHVHTSWKFRADPHPMVNVGVDMWDYAPVSLDQIRALLDEQS